MQDIQKERANRDIFIDQVGVSDIKYPLRIKQKNGLWQSTIATLTLSVSLPKELKGTHMSRFLTVIHNYDNMDLQTLNMLIEHMLDILQAENAYVKIEFPYFIRKNAPVSNNAGLLDYNCMFIAGTNGDYREVALTVNVPVTSLCPCSKAISDRGAHNQRGIVSIKVRASGREEILWIEDLVSIAEDSASCSVYPILKREDEKFVTEKAYDNPVFVEDIVREVAWKLKELDIEPFEVNSINHESIHNHSAFAKIAVGKFELL